MDVPPPSPVDTVVQMGGKLEGQGAYGCVFGPPLLTQSTHRQKKGGVKLLGKVTEYSEVAKEIEMSKFLGRFQETRKYCILPDIRSFSKLKPLKDQTDEDIEDCGAFKRFDMDDMYQFTVEYGGDTLHERLTALKTDINTFPFFKFAQNLLEVGAFLLLHGCIHNDIHNSNILANKSYTPRLIDFGRSYIYNQITKDTITGLSAKYAPELKHITPESTSFDGITDGVSIGQIYRDLYLKKETLKLVEQVLGVSRAKQIEEFRRFWSTSICAQAEDWLTLHRLYWTVADSWAIGNTLIQILKRFKMSKKFLESSEWKQKGPIIQAVIKGLLRTSPYYRYDALEALAMYDPTNAFVLSESGRAWLTQKEKRV